MRGVTENFTLPSSLFVSIDTALCLFHFRLDFTAWFHTDIIRTTTSELSRMCFVGNDSDSVWIVNHCALELPYVMADLSFTSNIISVLTAFYKFKHS